MLQLIAAGSLPCPNECPCDPLAPKSQKVSPYLALSALIVVVVCSALCSMQAVFC